MKEEKTQGNNERKEELGREGEEEKREGRTIGDNEKQGRKEGKTRRTMLQRRHQSRKRII